MNFSALVFFWSFLNYIEKNMKSAKEMLLNLNLYQHEKIDNYEKLFNLKYFRGTIDFYCPCCESISVFEGTQGYCYHYERRFVSYDNLLEYFDSYENLGNEVLLNQFYHVNLRCTRDKSSLSEFIYMVTDSSITKIGQFPSKAEMLNPELKKYKKVLSNEKYKELNRAIGLTTHGVGIGAFVYLRRIFESEINDAFKKAKESFEAFDEVAYKKGRMDDKINLLKEFLPNFLHENREIYGILSKGIHELYENECLEYFEVMKVGIELILDEKLEQLEKEEKQVRIKNAISGIKGKMK